MLAALLPLSRSEVASGAAAEIPSVRVGAAVTAGAAACGAFIHVLAPTKGLVEIEARWADALETSQGVVAGGRAAGGGAGALVFICTQRRRN